MTKRVYALRGHVRCGYCERRMEATPRGDRSYYRCAARNLVPGSPVLERHPKNAYLPERSVLEVLNRRRGAAEVEQAQQPGTGTISRAEVYTMIDYLGDVGAALERGDPAEL